MKVLADTSVWSLALRRKSADLNAVEQSLVHQLRDLIREDRVQLLGAIRQEVLSGIRNPEQFEKIRAFLRPFPDESLDVEDYEMAAKVNNTCRGKGIAVSAVDALICAVALRRDFSILTTDPDFKHYSRVLPLKLHPHGRAN
jgi:predicted nucleic acid-binding protein